MPMREVTDFWVGSSSEDDPSDCLGGREAVTADELAVVVTDDEVVFIVVVVTFPGVLTEAAGTGFAGPKTNSMMQIESNNFTPEAHMIIYFK